MNWKGFVSTGHGLILRKYPGIRLEGLRKTTKNLILDSRSPGRDLNPGPSEYEVGMLTTRLRCLVPHNLLSETGLAQAV
jgi:hypothetical protein